jgi:ABC-type multidrug transport system ATPase subunit
VEQAVIRFQNVSFYYQKDEPVLSDINLELQSGLTMLLGPNGCGKSTLLKLAAGVEKPDTGSITIDGHNVWSQEIDARKGLAYVPEQPDLTPYATLNEILNLVCRLRHEPLERGREALEFFDLHGLASRTVRELSLGQRRRAVFAAALIGQPRHILLDEPLEGMDRKIKEDILKWTEPHLEARATMVVVSHAVEPFLQSVSRAVTVKDGSISVIDELPVNSKDRLVLLDKLAKGIPLY